MAIPWLIGAAAVATVVAATKMWSDNEKNSEHSEHARKDEEAKEAEKKKQQEAHLRNLEQFAFDSGKFLAEKYNIEISVLGDTIFSIAGIQGVARSSLNSFLGNSIFSKEVSYLAIHQPEKCKEEFRHIFNQSKKVIDMNNQKDYFKNEIEEINNLSVIISNMGRL